MRAQVVQLDRGYPLVRTNDGRLFRCKHATALVKSDQGRAVIGDWVQAELEPGSDMAQITTIEPRRTQLVRKDPSERSLPQVLAANFDTVIIAHPLAEVNVQRLERELVLAFETGARVAIALTKADLADGDSTRAAAETVREIVDERVRVLEVSADDPKSIESVRALIPAGTIAVLMGRSGVGKSSLVNLLCGATVQETQEVRATDGKGRHTTVNRTMVPVEGGGLVVDMPGVRGLGMWNAEKGIAKAFADVEDLAAQCRFRDCTHHSEPGCAVQQAVEDGSISARRVESYLRLVEENNQQRKKNEVARRMRGRGRKKHGSR